MQTEARLPAGPAFPILNGWTGNLILRPWFDAVAVHAVANWFLPVSRAWAAGIAAQGDADRFAASVGIDARMRAKIKPSLPRLDDARRRYDDAETRWQEAFFGSEAVSDSSLAERETARFHAATTFMAMRRLFFFCRRKFPQVDWSVASPAQVLAAHGARLEDKAAAFPAPDVPRIDLSRLAPGVGGREGWLRMASPSRATGDTAWAHVFWPEGQVRGVVVSLHGILMEQEMWPVADPVSQMVRNGFCVIRPEGPWHGRRRPVAAYGGEPVFATGILGFIELFEAWVAEAALWIQWARAEVGARVGLAGISLGALTAQLVVARCGQWPPDMRPDAALLITTTGDNTDALRGSLARHLHIRDMLSAAGWNDEEISRWRPLIDPAPVPAIDPNGIVMALGDADTVTPFEGGKTLAAQWGVPPENLLVKHQGHFSTALGLYHDRAPLDRLAQILES